MSNITVPSIEEMLEAGVHFGHTTSKWHPKMEPFLYGKRGEIHIIDLAKTREKLGEALKFLKNSAKEGKTVLFVGVKPLLRQAVKAEADRAESPYAVNRWLGGTLTNWNAVLGMIKRMKELEGDRESGRLEKYTKKEQLLFTEEIARLEGMVGGLRLLNKLPDIIYLVDIMYDRTALREAARTKIPVVAIVDSNVNPGKVQYPIPANDDALKSVSLITKAVADSVLEGKQEMRMKQAIGDQEKIIDSESKSDVKD